MPATPEDRRRRDWQREVVKAIDTATPSSGTPAFKGVERVLAKMDGWLKQRTLDDPPLDDPRLDWELWVQGPERRADNRSAYVLGTGIRNLSPLVALLDVDSLPVAYKRHALAITERLEALCPYWTDIFTEQRYYGGVPLTTWLRCADLPEARAFFDQRHQHGHPGPDGQAWTPPQEEWSHAFARWLMNPVTFARRRNDPREVAPARRLALFQAAVDHGWLPADLLSRYEWSESLRQKTPGEMLVPALLNAEHSGRLPELLASVDRPGGLFDHWRRTTPDWSTWVSPTSQTTVWRSLLANHDPGLLLTALDADPQALDRPVPMGRWFRNLPTPQERQYPTAGLNGVMRQDVEIPGVAAASRRSFAGMTFGTYNLDQAMRATPSQADRLRTWWNDPAPRLRDTIELLAHHLLPVGTPSGTWVNEPWARQVGGVAERLLLNETLNQDAQDSSPAVRSGPRPRTRL